MADKRKHAYAPKTSHVCAAYGCMLNEKGSGTPLSRNVSEIDEMIEPAGNKKAAKFPSFWRKTSDKAIYIKTNPEKDSPSKAVLRGKLPCANNKSAIRVVCAAIPVTIRINNHGEERGRFLTDLTMTPVETVR
jgi:hypothetical protein